jgi:predicted transcriptional regulator
MNNLCKGKESEKSSIYMPLLEIQVAQYFAHQKALNAIFHGYNMEQVLKVLNNLLSEKVEKKPVIVFCTP